MEYVALLTTGRRMRAVLADQADSLLQAEDPSAANVARLICGAHVLGVAVDAARLGDGAGAGAAAMTRALRRLQDEHIVVAESSSMWRGLHQRRSDVLTELLHATPPPDVGDTIATVLRLMQPGALGWALRRTVELFPGRQPKFAEAITTAVARCTSAVELAGLLEGLERADHSLTARAFLPILSRYRQPSMPLSAISMLACGEKLAGIRFGSDGDGLLGALGQRIHRCAQELPDRSTVFSDCAVSALGGRLSDFVVDATIQDAVRLLEAAALYVTVSGEELDRIATAFPWPAGLVPVELRVLHGRLRAACHVLAPSPSDFTRSFGELAARLESAASSVSNVVSASLNTSVERSAYLELLAAEDEVDEMPLFGWDQHRPSSDSSDAINRRAVDLAAFIGDCCPDLDIVEVRTVIADRAPLTIGDFEPGHKRLGRNARPPRGIVRVNVGIQAAIARQDAAYSWTELVRSREQIAISLATLAEDAPRRVAMPDHPKRRERWISELDDVTQRLAGLPRPPTTATLDPTSEPARWDEERDEDPLSRALRSAADALRMLTPSPAGKLVYAGAGDAVLRSASELAVALREGSSLTTAAERTACGQLLEGLRLLRDVLVSLGFDVQLTKKIRGRPEDLIPNLRDLVSCAAARQVDHERSELHDLFQQVDGAVVLEVPDPKPFVTSVVGHQWLITVPPGDWDAVAQVAAERRPLDVAVPVSIACAHDGALLPIAGRLSSSVGTGFFPVGEDQLGGLAAAAEMPMMRGPTLSALTEIIREVAQASWEAARSKLRPEHWSAPGANPGARLDQAEGLARCLGEGNPLAEITQEMVERVREEIEGRSARAPFAAELASAVVLDAQQFEEDHGPALVARGVFVAIDTELWRAACT